MNVKMVVRNYQLVLQWNIEFGLDLNSIVQIEEKLIKELASLADVDGHDFGSGEMNIFVLTDQPKETFAQIKESLKEIRVLGGMKAAFRQMADDKFIVLYPGTLKSFSVL